MTGTLIATVCGKMNNKKLAATFWSRFFLVYWAATGFIINIKVFTKY